MYSIYLIVHNDSGRVYVGQTSMPLDLRLQCHYRPSSRCYHIRNAIQKYGASAFTNYELARGLSKTAADTLEVALIAEHDSTRTGFNIALGGLKGRQRNVCRNGHDLLAHGAMDGRNRCRICLHNNQRTAYLKLRSVPESWANRLAKSRDYKRNWRAARQLQAA